MTKAVLLAVDDDPAVARAVERDLRRRYLERFRILRADSAAAALELVESVVRRGEQVALLLVDQRMPEMTGVEFLVRAIELVPTARRVLLTAYADTEAAIRAINEVRLDHYLMKPWDPPDERLYPVLDDVLEDWEAERARSGGGLRVVGHRWSAASHQIRDFLTRNGVPYRWLDSEREEVGFLLDAAGIGAERLPVVFFEDGSTLVQPMQPELAERVGLRIHAELPFYDVAIVGGGPAGLAAAVYGASEGLRTVLVEREATGGQAGQSSRIENYLGFPAGLSGADLARRATAQARRLGAELVTAREAAALEVSGPSRLIRLDDGSQLACHSVVLAMGVRYRRLEAPGVDALTGAGVYYGSATSEAVALAGQDAVVVGGANSAGQAAVFLARHARRVAIVCRGSSLEKSMSRYLVDQVESIDTIDVRLGATVLAAQGDARLEAVEIEQDGRPETLPAGGMFVFIGAQPNTAWLGEAVARDERGFVYSGPAVRNAPDARRRWPLERDPYLLETSVPGVFAVGDVRDQSLKRVASAVGEGSMAVQLVHQYLGGL